MTSFQTAGRSGGDQGLYSGTAGQVGRVPPEPTGPDGHEKGPGDRDRLQARLALHRPREVHDLENPVPHHYSSGWVPVDDVIGPSYPRPMILVW